MPRLLEAGNSLIHNVVSGAAKRWDNFVNACRNSWPVNGSQDVDPALVEEQDGEKKTMKVEHEKDGGNWDWERWKRHFLEIEEQEKLVSDLKGKIFEVFLL